ncbi:MAG TPA: hypothetical protein VFW29_01530 [Solirubrobacteraceae bacterium]|nr:hypothetical protein [Solirubrobacteraceae bacterium]
MTATVVELGKLLDVVLFALGATVGVAILFSLAILGVTQASERRGQHRAAAIAYGTLAVVGLAGCVAAAGYGLVLLTSK